MDPDPVERSENRGKTLIPFGSGLAVGLVLLLLWFLDATSAASLAGQTQVAIPASLERPHDPVILTGMMISDLLDCSLDTLFLYAYQDTKPVQIPFQIDERNHLNLVVPYEDNLLDLDDEIVFMASDVGGWVEEFELNLDGEIITPAYVITITDPLSDTQGWVYLLQSEQISLTFSSDYVSYQTSNDRISSAGTYVTAFHPTYAIRDYLTLGEGRSDLLDRDKIRLSGSYYIIPFQINEEDTQKESVYTIDGPVRVARVSTSSIEVGGTALENTSTLFAYRSLLVQPVKVEVPTSPIHVSSVRGSTDWSSAAVGMTYYDQNNPGGILIDGNDDSPVTTPATNWTQVSGTDGTILYVSKIPQGLQASASTYYKDYDDTVEEDDTGDKLSYGDAGFLVNNPPAGTYTLIAHSYFITETQANVGAHYLKVFNNPLQVESLSKVPKPTPTPTSTATGTPTPTHTPTPNGTAKPHWVLFLPLIANNPIP